jgi:hypothetical protein
VISLGFTVVGLPCNDSNASRTPRGGIAVSWQFDKVYKQWTILDSNR